MSDSVTTNGTVITPTTMARFYNFENEYIEIPLITLAVWRAGMRARIKAGEDIYNVEKVIKRYLKTPKGYKLVDIQHHLDTVMAEIHEQLGLPPPGPLPRGTMQAQLPDLLKSEGLLP